MTWLVLCCHRFKQGKGHLEGAGRSPSSCPKDRPTKTDQMGLRHLKVFSLRDSALLIPFLPLPPSVSWDCKRKPESSKWGRNAP